MINTTEHIDRRPAKQGAEEVMAEPNRIGASTPYGFEAKNRAGETCMVGDVKIMLVGRANLVKIRRGTVVVPAKLGLSSIPPPVRARAGLNFQKICFFQEHSAFF